MSRWLLAVVLGVVVAVLAVPAAAATPSPIGTWLGQNGDTYRWAALPGGGYEEHSLTAHYTTTNHCFIRPGTIVYRYHALGTRLFRVDSFLWDKQCKATWSNGDDTVKLRALTATKMTLYHGSGYTKVWFSYTRKASDTEAPFVKAIESTGTVGGTTALRYAAHDNSGKTWDELTIYRNGKVARHYKTTLGPSKVGRIYAYKLDQTPASFRGAFRFCVRSHDAAGNVSKPSCATVTIR